MPNSILDFLQTLDAAASVDRILRRNIQTPITLLTAPGPFTLTVLQRTARVDATAAPTLVNLPSAVGLAGMLFEIKKIDASANAVTVDAAGAETIDGALTVVLPKQYDTVVVRSDGTNWIKIAGIGSTIVIGGAGSLWGNCLFVDIVNGNNATAVRGDSAFPYLTVNAAIAAALSGDTIVVRPGTYPVTPFTIPTGVAIFGLGQTNDVVFQALGVVAATTLVTMGINSRIQNIKIEVTSGGHFTITGVSFPGSTSASARIMDCFVSVDNGSAPGGGSSDITGIDVAASGNTEHFEFLQRVRIFVRSTGQGTKRGIHAQASGRTLAFHPNIRVEKQGGGTGTYIGAETTAASTILLIKGGIIDGSVQGGSASIHDDIRQSNGTIVLEDTELVNNDAGGLGFTPLYSSYGNVWFAEGAVAAGATRFLFPCGVPSATEPKRGAERALIIRGMRVRARVASGGGQSTTYTLRRNGVNTGITVAISGGTTSAAFSGNVSVSYAAGDDISIEQVASASSAAADIGVSLDVY